MAYACHKCGSAIEEGTPFCPHCGAPQIRVAVPESESPAFAPGTPAEMQPPAEPVPLSAIPFPSAPADGINWRAAVPGALAAGVSIGVGSMIPLGLAWVVLVTGFGAALSVFLYRRRVPLASHLRAGEGAKIGALASIFGYILLAIMVVLTFVLDTGQVRQEMLHRLQTMQSSNPDAQAMYQQLAQKLTTPEGLAFIVTFGMAVMFFFFIAVGAAGGALSVTLTRRDRR